MPLYFIKFALQALHIVRGALVFCAAIHQTLFRQNVLRGNSSNFNDVKLSRYTVSYGIIIIVSWIRNFL